MQTTASIAIVQSEQLRLAAIVRPEQLRLGSIIPGAVSRRGRRSLNADAVATYTDPIVGRAAFVVADGIGDNLLAARAARTAASVAARVGARDGAQSGVLAAQQELLRQFPEQQADCVLVVAVLPAAGQPDGPSDIAWVGDCRAYRWNGRVLHQMTTDHTVAEFMRAKGIRPSGRMDHLVTTSTRTVTPSAIGHAATGSSRGILLLSTDGVHKRLDMVEIKSALTAGETPGSTAETLVDNALLAGSTDNTTALVVNCR
ncbi:PP2C family protein-serine/threonine phosphatase [Nocardia nepalensis]|uniref:PP2C family protein-serine/threonine phosphatase n=1 Tax=Nocardia nepalensis TaxID=3375448 RepID=UPI003B67A8B8